MTQLRAVILAILTMFATNAAQYGYNAAQAAVLAHWWADYAKGAGEKEAALANK